MASSNELLVLGLSAAISDDVFLDERRSIALGFLGSLEASDPSPPKDCIEELLLAALSLSALLSPTLADSGLVAYILSLD
jgi:hypothetical protein